MHAIIRGPTNTTTDKGVFSCPRGSSRTHNLFQNEKSVLPGNVDLKHETAICMDIISGVATKCRIVNLSGV
jgi:hypothetical protein